MNEARSPALYLASLWIHLSLQRFLAEFALISFGHDAGCKWSAGDCPAEGGAGCKGVLVGELECHCGTLCGQQNLREDARQEQLVFRPPFPSGGQDSTDNSS